MTQRQSRQRQSEADALGPWFHNLHLPDGTQTAPDHPLGDFPRVKWQHLVAVIPADLRGWRALDIGCNAGFYTFELAKRGAQVVAIDVDQHYLDQAQWAARQYNLEQQIEFRRWQIYDLARTDEQFDLILFMGVFYHLRYPLLGLDLVAQRLRRMLVFQSLMIKGHAPYTATDGLGIQDDREVMNDPGWPKLAFIEHTFANDPTNWWVPNTAGAEALLRSAGLRVEQNLGYEMLICAPDPDNRSCVTTWNRAELLAATGRPWQV